MKRSLVVGLALLALGLSVSAQRNRVPSFNQYPARVERVKAKAIDFRNSPGARTFRTRLSEALKEGVNFAGHYIYAGWGCGTGCISAAIIDARTGRVYFPEPIGGIAAGIADDDEGYVEDPLRYQTNSRLLIINGIPATQIEGRRELPNGTYYYEWTNNRLRLIRSVPSRKN